MGTFDLDETASYLKADTETVRELAESGEIPAAKIGRSWVFLEADVHEYLTAHVRAQTAKRRDGIKPPTAYAPIRRKRGARPKLPDLGEG